jgi:hypothetical protein
MKVPRLVLAKEYLVPLMEKLEPYDSAKPCSNTSLGYFSIEGIQGQVIYGEFLLMISQDPMNGLMNVASNTGVLWEHPLCMVALQTDPSLAVQRLLSIISGVDLSDLKVPPMLWPAVHDAAVDIYKSPCYFCRPKSIDITSLKALASKLISRGVNDILIDNPSLLHLSPRKASTPGDFPEICAALRSIAVENHMVVLGAAPIPMKLTQAVQLADQAIRVEDFGNAARFSLLRPGQTKPEFHLATRQGCGRYGNQNRMPWGMTAGKRFEAARKK